MPSTKSKKVKKANQNTPSDIWIDETGFAYTVDLKKANTESNDIIYEICPASSCTIGQSYSTLIKEYAYICAI
mgnify:CR=1 FL=1